MSERYYVVTESELARLKKAVVNEALANSDRWSSEDEELQEAEAACRARFVPEWATHFARACPRNLEELVFDSSEEIER